MTSDVVFDCAFNPAGDRLAVNGSDLYFADPVTRGQADRVGEVLVGCGFWHSHRASHTVAVESQLVGAHV